MTSLYVFYVNRGYLIALDYEVSVQTVRKLQHAIRDETGIGSEEQLLLTWNGTRMEAEKRVNNYEQVGSMAKPVYLYARSARTEKDGMTISQQRDEISRDIVSTIDTGEQYMRMKDFATQYLRLSEHAQLCRTVAENTVTATARIVQEHHNLNGGWNALVSNINETVIKLERKQKRFDTHVAKLAELTDKTTDLMSGFDECVEQLKTMVLPASMQVNGQETTLYDWITASDPNHSLRELLEQVHEQLQMANTTDVDTIKGEIRYVKDLVEKSDNQEIRGINKRISQIEHSLAKLSDFKDEIHKQSSTIRRDNPKGMDEYVLKEMVDKHRTMVINMHELLKKMNESCILFYKSKGEVLDNVRNRLFGWVVTACEKLYTVNSMVVLFEEKFHGLRQRLDLVRQVKETPLMFATCITEIVRRKQLQKEFRAWHQQHTERSHTFTGEENQLRTVFAAKLEKHFLRVIFQGMFDKLPVFFVKLVPEFDTQLPDIDTEYYKDLRKKVGSLESVLRVNSPQVHMRLSGRPSSLVSCASQPHLRREESFISYEQASNLTTNLQNAFPSSAWLNHDTDVDMSPCPEPAILMMQAPESVGPNGERRERNPFAAGQRLPSLHDIHEHEDLSHFLSHSLKSAPICIPSASRSPRDDQPERVSPCSSNDDPLCDSKEEREQFAIDDISTRSQMMEVLRPMVDELRALKGELEDTRSTLDVYRGSLDGDIQDVVDRVTACHWSIVESMREEHGKEMDAEKARYAALEAQIANLEKTIEKREEELAFRDGQIEGLRQIEEAKNEEIEKLKTELAGADARQKEATDEIFKKLIIEYELAKDREASDFREIIEEKEESIRQLQKELEKKAVEIEKLKKGPGAEEYRQIVESEVRANMEKEFKSRVELLSKGIEQKKDDAIARMRKDVEFEHKKKEAEKDIDFRLAMFERDMLRDSSSSDLLEDVKKSVEQQKEKLLQDGHFSPFFITSPRASPRKPLSSVTSMSGSLVGSLSSLTSPTQESPSSEFAITPPTVVIPSPAEELVMPKIIAPGDLTPKSNENYQNSSSKEDSDATPEEDKKDDERDEMEEKKESPPTTAMEESFIPGYNSNRVFDRNEERLDTVEETTDGQHCMSVQTKIGGRAMDFMVSLNDIREGSTVLVVWDDRHKSYILFCISNYIHFVKETSVRRLGLSNTAQELQANPRKNWVLARVAHVDLCVIKKSTNRYMLPVDTQVYRVDVHPIAFDTSLFNAATMPSLRA
ncbi:hypothetical protein PFISCL1PPCAC_28040 [Pristionchus fissidentatus]|uniref:Autophagy-related protein 11 C-terminal domain-containing protein n=1 Tax=Pristionchus fissidentatus TaxID=1538716 RepID=A0AAV5X0X2_9BILA|nr:hypothetical protein PFISCL1PPCAC_28040 [Pristionchus fissidentatus]